MIGAGKTQVIGVTVAPDYSVNLTPGQLNISSSNGSETSPTVFSDVIAGVGPFEYLWTIDNSEITINSPAVENTTFTSRGFNQFVIGTSTLTVLDLGNGSAETSRDIVVDFEFGL